MKSFRDPVHNLIAFGSEDRWVVDLINTREMQRLRRVRQLGLSNVAYPGAEHSRFTHSLGVAHLMRRFLDSASASSGVAGDLADLRPVALAAALLHDVGHGPFSHAIEAVTGERHERWTVAMIRSPESEVHEVLEGHETGLADRVARVVERDFPESRAIVKLLSSQLDVDRMDYLLRDAMMTGAGYGSFDVEWLLHVMRIGSVGGEPEVGLDLAKGQSIAEDYIMCRYYMYRHVYFHPTTRAAEVMVEALLARAREVEARVPGFSGLNELLSGRLRAGGKGQFEAYLELDDSVLWAAMHLFARHEDGVLRDLAERLLQRKVFRAKEASTGSEQELIAGELRRIAKGRGLAPEFYVLTDTAGSSAYRDSYIALDAEEGGGPSEGIFLFDGSGRARELSAVSFVVNAVRKEPVTVRRVFFAGELQS